MIIPVAELETRYAPLKNEENKWRMFKKADMPSTVFLGGVTNTPKAALFNRPLRADDFIDLFRA